MHDLKLGVIWDAKLHVAAGFFSDEVEGNYLPLVTDNSGLIFLLLLMACIKAKQSCRFLALWNVTLQKRLFLMEGTDCGWKTFIRTRLNYFYYFR